MNDTHLAYNVFLRSYDVFLADVVSYRFEHVFLELALEKQYRTGKQYEENKFNSCLQYILYILITIVCTY